MKVKDLILIFAATLFIILCTQIRIEWSWSSLHIPITGQSFAVLLAGYALGSRKGLLSVLLYILLGAAGVPVFSDGAAGLEVLGGPSGGYLFGFLLGSWVCGLLAERGWGRSYALSLLAMASGTVLILLCGGLYLCYLYDLPTAWKAGVKPFLAGGIVKIILGAAVMPLWFGVRGRGEEVK